MLAAENEAPNSDVGSAVLGIETRCASALASFWIAAVGVSN